MNVFNLPIWSRTVIGAVKRTCTAQPDSEAAVDDPRWPRIQAALLELQSGGRHAVRIVDADCGAGTLLLHAMGHARQLGFTAVEGHGIDRSSLLIGRARLAARHAADPALGVDFEAADMITALRDEQDLPADIVICHDLSRYRPPEAARAVRNAGRVVIADDAACNVQGIAA
ncbi:methyltransferase domain-containing protein [Sphingomonas sp. OK281]|uniref:methyltransferase domain-containing protein n=1 Tax=Sphingomonas sp. OK281 TaxID=1881067 RepID=UPI0008EA0001|nr:methyltransferase domain-containing protein [Sphingomonas sp. OK281]SFO30656.1 Methyltransferase domain-containing protein [Sphingomonas sp. OK281]